MTDEELLEDLAAGGPRQRSALERLYHGKGREFRRLFFRLGLSDDEADDALQEIILKILRHAADDRGQAPAAAWMRRIAINTGIDHLRRQASRREQGFYDEQGEHAENHLPALQVTDDPDPARLVADCVTKGFDRFALAEPERAYALELQTEGMDMQKVAESIGRTYGATREYLSQCRKRLKPFIKHCLPLLQD